MSRREYPIRRKCAHEGCREISYSVASTRAEEREARQSYARNPWKCSRHIRPDEVLSLDNRETSIMLTVGRSPNHPGLKDLFWTGEGVFPSGFTHGAGYRAFAEDFPAGTRLVITARIETDGGA